MSKHTTGTIVVDEREGHFLLTADRSATDVEAVGVVYKRADADLFAAASALLDACKNMVDWYGGRSDTEELLPSQQQDYHIAVAMAVIARAESPTK